MLANHLSQNDDLQVQRETLSQKVRWTMIEEDTQSLPLTTTCACAGECTRTQCTHIHTHRRCTHILTHKNKQTKKLRTEQRTACSVTEHQVNITRKQTMKACWSKRTRPPAKALSGGDI